MNFTDKPENESAISPLTVIVPNNEQQISLLQSETPTSMISPKAKSHGSSDAQSHSQHSTSRQLSSPSGAVAASSAAESQREGANHSIHSQPTPQPASVPSTSSFNTTAFWKPALPEVD